MAGTLAVAPAASAAPVPVDDSVNVNTVAHDQGASGEFNHQGSSLIETVVVDVGDLAVILDTVSLLSWANGPFG